MHSAFGSLLANLSMQGHMFDVTIGVVLYLAYQIFEWTVKKDAIYKDTATFTAGYFITLTAKYIPL
jgi:cytochrome bd-type quinol oxidase subunit 1